LWQAIAILYNRERFNQLTPPGAACSSESIETWLKTCATWARTYLYPSIASLNAPRTQLDREGSPLQDDLPDPHSPSLLAELIAQEEAQNRQQQQAQIQAVLLAAVNQLDAETRYLLQLYYQQGLTQQQIAQRLDVKQYTISRRLTRVRETFLTALMQWSQEFLHISPTSDLVKRMSVALEEWLLVYETPSDLSSSAAINKE